MEYLYNKLKEYAESQYYGFHMPGHKRNASVTGAGLPYGIDITEISGFDDLHHAEGILLECQKRAAEMFHADESHYLVNGSTVGILSAVLGCTTKGGKILMSRNCHKSAYNAVLLNELRPVYIYPEVWSGTGLNGPADPAQVEMILEEDQEIEAVLITSPTYDGVVSDVRKIAQIVHKKKLPLIVDEAHGAHFGFHSYFPENSNQAGADIVIHSLHKTLPSLTQTALLHMNGNIVDRTKVRQYLHMLQSSSPSYVLMAAIDECIRVLKEQGEKMFSAYTEVLDQTRRALGSLKCLKLLETDLYDWSKILISCKDVKSRDGRLGTEYTGRVLYEELLEKYLLQMEMAAPSYIIAMTAPGDTRQGMKRLVKAVTEIDSGLVKTHAAAVHEKQGWHERNQQVWTPAEAERKRERKSRVLNDCKAERNGGYIFAESAGWKECAGTVALEYAYVYPPGIPLVVPGERISEKTADKLAAYEQAGFQIEGTQTHGKIEVIKNG